MGLFTKQNFRVAESTNKGGITAPEADIKYGAKMLSLFEAFPILENEKNWKNDRETSYEVRPIRTKTHAVFSRQPLGETIQKDGGASFLVDKSEGTSCIWYCQIPDELLKNPKILNMANVLFTFEKEYETRQIGQNQYLTIINNANAVQYASIPDVGWTTTNKHPTLFGNGIENLRTTIGTTQENVRVGLVSVGNGPANDRGVPHIYAPGLSCMCWGVLIRTDDAFLQAKNAINTILMRDKKQLEEQLKQHDIYEMTKKEQEIFRQLTRINTELEGLAKEEQK